MRPTNGEISVMPPSPQATAWAKPNSSVRLQWMPSVWSSRAAAMPSQVDAILMSTRLRPIPAASYNAMMPRARATVALVSNDRRASTSVLTRPGTTFRISRPKRTSTWSTTSGRDSPLWAATVSASSGA